MKPFSEMTSEDKTSAVMQLIRETVVSVVHTEWYLKYKAHRDRITDATSMMRSDLAFSDKIGVLRKLGALVATPGEIREKAEEIATMSEDQIYGAATKYGASIVVKELVVIRIKAYASEQDRKQDNDAKANFSVITVQDFDRVIQDSNFPNFYISFTGQDGKHFGHQKLAREAIESQSVVR